MSPVHSLALCLVFLRDTHHHQTHSILLCLFISWPADHLFIWPSVEYKVHRGRNFFLAHNEQSLSLYKFAGWPKRPHSRKNRSSDSLLLIVLKTQIIFPPQYSGGLIFANCLIINHYYLVKFLILPFWMATAYLFLFSSPTEYLFSPNCIIRSNRDRNSAQSLFFVFPFHNAQRPALIRGLINICWLLIYDAVTSGE